MIFGELYAIKLHCYWLPASQEELQVGRWDFIWIVLCFRDIIIYTKKCLIYALLKENEFFIFLFLCIKQESINIGQKNTFRLKLIVVFLQTEIM